MQLITQARSFPCPVQLCDEQSIARGRAGLRRRSDRQAIAIQSEKPQLLASPRRVPCEIDRRTEAPGPIQAGIRRQIAEQRRTTSCRQGRRDPKPGCAPSRIPSIHPTTLKPKDVQMGNADPHASPARIARVSVTTASPCPALALKLPGSRRDQSGWDHAAHHAEHHGE